jgi:hypothetical protein
MKVHECRTLHGAAEVAVSIAIQWGDRTNDPTLDIWYRGANDNYDLVPSSYWKDADEWSSFVTFSQLVRSTTDSTGFDRWDYYCLARHHGIPTRLLDWSEGFMQALFFAFDGWRGKNHGTPCIWMLRPDVLNTLGVGEDTILTPGGDDCTALWLPPIEPRSASSETETWTNEKPIAIYPARSNPRVIGQLGTFTVHGVDRTPLNKMLKDTGKSDESLARIDFVDFDVKDVRRRLHYMGLRQGVIYPDPDHIARDIGYIYKWLD